MPEHDDPVTQKVVEWLAYADEDMSLARHTLSHMKSAPHRLVAYHAQQCAEKCLKAYLVSRGVDFPYTHSIARLLELCEGMDWPTTLKDAEELGPYAITTRYPGIDEPVTKDEAEAAIEVADKVREAVRAELRRLGTID